MIGCGCSTCTSENPKNRRNRCSVIWGLPEGNLLIDTPPELRLQLVQQRIGLVHTVCFTHGHADHVFGLDDLRIFPRYLKQEMPVYCEEMVERHIRRSFAYAFDPVTRRYPAGGVPRLIFRRIQELEPFEALGARVVPIRLMHGKFVSLGYRIGDVAYCTDVKEIPSESMKLLEGLDILIVDCLRPEPHVTHMNVDEAIDVVRKLKPRRALFTHISHRLEHEKTNMDLPEGMELAFDGMELELNSIDG